MQNLILAPLPEQIPLLRMLILLLVFVFLSYAGVLIVSTGAALIAGFWRPAVEKRLRAMPVSGAAAGIVFGLLPLASLIFLWGAALHGTRSEIVVYLARILLLALLAGIALQLHERRGHRGAGALGLLLLIGAAFHFVATLALVTYPEKWPFIRTPLPLLYSIQAVIQFKLFLACAALLTGATLLLRHLAWPEREAFADPADEAALRRVGWGLVLAGALLAPPLLVWDFYSAPAQSLTLRVFAAALAMLALAFLAALLTLAMIRRGQARSAGVLVALGLALMGLLAYRGHAARANAAQEIDRVLAGSAEKRYEALVAEQESAYKIGPPDEALGEQIYRERCTACHAFDRKVVGPPYDEVVPRYAGDLAALAEFILNPKRVDPSYPAMPSQGLRTREAQSAAIFLMKRVTGEADAAVFGAGPEGEPAGEPPAREEGRP